VSNGEKKIVNIIFRLHEKKPETKFGIQEWRYQ